MLPKIPYSMEKNKSMTVPIGNYNISSNFKPGDIADSYGISARRYPQLTNRRGRELYMDVYGIHEEVPSDLVGMAVFNGEIVTVITNVDTAIYVEGEKIYNGLDYNFDTRQLVAINNKLVIYPDKVYLEKVDGEWEVNTLHETCSYKNVTFETDKIVVNRGEEISGHGVKLNGIELTFSVEEDLSYPDVGIFWDEDKGRNVVAYTGSKKNVGTTADVTKTKENNKYFISVFNGDLPDNSLLYVYLQTQEGNWYRGSVSSSSYNITEDGRQYANITATFPAGIPELDGEEFVIEADAYWVGNNDRSPFENLVANIVDGTWFQFGGYIDSFSKLNKYELVGESKEKHKAQGPYSYPGAKLLGWSLYDLEQIKAGDMIEVNGYEGDILIVKEVPDIEADTYYASITITLERSSTYVLNTLDEITIRYSSDPEILKFNNGDGVTISGCVRTSNNKTFVISKNGMRAILASADIFEEGEESSITIERKIPDLDFICERDNRLYGVNNAEKTIYVSSLGDSTNMYVYEGAATDSFAVPVGGEGDFTGCCKYGESVLFFKEDKIYKLTGYTPADFAIDSYDVDGLQAGSYKSLVVINEVLYYKGKNGVFAYTGGIPTLISEGFGETVFKGGSAGTDGISYYLSTEKGGKTHLFVYNTRLGLWTREGDERYYTFVRKLDGLYAADNGGIDKLNVGAIDPEWMVQFVPFYETIEGKKIYSRLLMRAELPRGSYMIIEVRSDDGVWREAGKIVGANKGIIPIRLPIARCDKFELRLRGKGEFVLHEILREYHVGSEV